MEPLVKLINLLKTSLEETLKLELKQLCLHVRCAFLGKSSTVHVIISAHLSKNEEKRLLRVLRDHIRAM